MAQDNSTARKQIGLYVDADVLTDFDAIADKNKRSRSGEIEWLMQRHVAANQRKLVAVTEEAAA